MIGSYKTSITQYGTNIILTVYAKELPPENVKVTINDDRILNIQLGDVEQVNNYMISI